MSFAGCTSATLADRWPVPQCLALDRVTSTLDVVAALATDGAPHQTLVLAEEQIRGRGRRGDPWHSPPGTGIWLGWLHRTLDTPSHGLLAVRAGLAAAGALGDLGVAVQLKWPNDLMLRDRKVGGVLCEAASVHGGGWVVIGIGINVHGPVPTPVADRAIALEDAHPSVTRLAVLDALIPRLVALDVDPQLSPAEADRFRACDWLVGREIATPVAGRAEGIDQSGALLVRTPHGTERVLGGHVVLA